MVEERFEDAFRRMYRKILRPMWNASDRCLEPLVNIHNLEEAVIVTVDLPCVADKDAIQLHVSEDAVDLQAQMEKAVRWDRWGTTPKKLAFASFRKLIALPARVDPDKTKAAFKNGVLRIVLPKYRRRIPVKVA